MKDIVSALNKEKQLHPKAEYQDHIKLIYQACFGPGHMIQDEAKSLYHLQQEKLLAKDYETPQDIGGDYVRVPLSFMIQKDLSLWNHLFVRSAANAIAQEELFREMMDVISIEPISMENLKQGVHHSESYRTLYDPHYRVIKKSYVDYFPVIAYIYEIMQEQSSSCFAIDGRCASGKSTLASILKELFSFPVFHMDDYFLTPDLRTESRLKKPGGNVDDERFYREILLPMSQKKDIRYRPYDCKEEHLMPVICVPYQPYTVMEGSYAHHPHFNEIKRNRIFLTCDYSCQLQRLQKRSPFLYDRFVKEWIPMEEQYFQTFAIEEHSDMVFDTTPL